MGGDRSRPGRFIEKDWLDRFMALLPPGGTVLDIGCGFGKPIAAYLIAQRLRRLRRRFIADNDLALPAGTSRSTNGYVGDMRTLALSRRFDGIIAWDSFFHLTL